MPRIEPGSKPLQIKDLAQDRAGESWPPDCQSNYSLAVGVPWEPRSELLSGGFTHLSEASTLWCTSSRGEYGYSRQQHIGKRSSHQQSVCSWVSLELPAR